MLPSAAHGGEDEQNSAADNEHDAEDDEADAVDDCSCNHPLVQHSLIPVRFAAKLGISAEFRLE